MIESIDAMVLAGGFGTRLRDHIPKNVPKCLVEIDGKPFLWILLDWIYSQGVRSFIVLTSYLQSQIELSVVAWTVDHRPVRVRFSQQPEPVGTIDAISRALTLLDSDPFLIFNGDSLCEVPLEKFCAEVQRGLGQICAVVDTNLVPVGIFAAQRKATLAVSPHRNLDSAFMQWLGDRAGFYFTEEPWFDIGSPAGLQAFKDSRGQGELALEKP